MEWVETTGRTVEDAKEAALDQLGVDESDAEFEVVEEARAGLFGRLRGEARVRARVRPTAPRAKDDRRDRRRRARANGENRETGPRTNGGDTPSDSPRDSRSTVDAPATPAATLSNASTAGPGEGASSGASGGAVAVAATGPDDQAGNSAGREASRRGNDNGGPTDAADAMDSRPGHNDQRQEGGNVEVALDEQGRVAHEFLTDLVAEFGLDATVQVVRPDEETVDLQLEGSDLGLLIGPRGATLLALQDLTRTFVHHRTGAGNGRLHVDVGGYRQKRTEALVRFALQVASTVQASGTRTVLEPMTAADRKVVHDAITPIDGVSTISEGEEPQRRVVVVPANP